MGLRQMLGRAAISLAIFAPLATAACGSSIDVPSGQLAAADVPMAKPPAHLDYGPLSTGVRELGSDLADRLVKRHPNLVFSPASLAIDFAMLREGSVGSTASDFDRVLHLPADRQRLFNGLLHEVDTPGPGNTLEIDDELFADQSLPLRRGFLAAIKHWYGAGVERVRFPSEAVAQINAWVADNTHGRIDHMLDSLPALAVAVLVNTVFLDAKWQYRFPASLTDNKPFYLAHHTTVSVATMHLMRQFDYASGPGWQAVRLPYGGDRLSMWLLLPGKGSMPAQLLAPSVLSAAQRRFAVRHVQLAIPRWHVESSMHLDSVLSAMGLSRDLDSADLAKMSSAAPFGLSVIQKATIEVGEKGTVASAATGGMAIQISKPLDLVHFTANHPFAFAIMQDDTGVPLFEGVVNNPAEQ